MSPHPYWSALLTAVFLASLVLVSRHNPWGWVLGLLDELLWTVYAILTRQWPFIISAVIYGAICVRNLRTSRPTPPTAGRHRAT